MQGIVADGSGIRRMMRTMRFLSVRLVLAGICLATTFSPALARDNRDPTDRARNTRMQEALKISKTTLMRRSLSGHQQIIHRSSTRSSSSAAPLRIANPRRLRSSSSSSARR